MEPDRIGRNIREAISPGCRQGRHATPMDRRMRLKQSAAPCESPTRSSRVPGRTGTRPPCRRRSLYLKSSRPGGVIGDATKRRSTSTNRSPRYSAMLWLNTKVDHSVRSGANLASRRGTRKLPTRPDQFACRSLASSFHLTRFIPESTSIEIGGSCGLIEDPCDEWSAGAYSPIRPLRCSALSASKTTGDRDLLLASTNWKGCPGSSQGKWNRKRRKWISARTGSTSCPNESLAAP
jgi:hypothetical protein